MLGALPRFPKSAEGTIGDGAVHLWRRAGSVGAIWILAVLCVVLGVSRGSADTLANPVGEVLLIVSGSIEKSNAPGMARLDRGMLESLPSHTIVTSTPWSEGKLSFTGPLARDVMSLVGASGRMVTAIGLNDYQFDIPFADFWKYDVIIAVKQNGHYMKIRDTGPLWIVYPLDQVAENLDATTSKMVWQLVRLVVR